MTTKRKFEEIVLYVSIVAIFVFGMNIALIPHDTTFGAILGSFIPLGGTTATASVANISAISAADKSNTNQMAVASIGIPTNKTFYLFNGDSGSNKNVTHMPPDTFVPDTITVNKGDRVNIIFWNTEPVKGGDPHNFMTGAPYDINTGNIPPQQSKVIHFVATVAGAFPFFCSIHMPTMRGELVILP
jgi:plastocyanin